MPTKPRKQGGQTAASSAVLPTWANGQDGWVRAIAVDVLKEHVRRSSADIERYLQRLLAEKKLSEDAFEPVPAIENKDIDDSPLEVVRLDKLTIDDGVNALKPGAYIDFAPTMTVIFGENGAGKSGFVRVLKRAAGARTAEDILHNVHTGNKPVPSATFNVVTGTKSEEIAWKNQFGINPLNRVSIFDARGARVHLEEDLTYVYTPGELTLFPLVQDGVERVRTALESTIAARTPGVNTLLGSFERTCSIYSTIETLGAATDLEEVKKYSAVPTNIDSTIEALKIEVDALSSTNVQSELKRARSRAALVASLKSAIEVAKTFSVPEYVTRIANRDAATQRSEEAGTKAFENVATAGILTEEWRGFIQAGDVFLKAYGTTTYPQADDACIYCQQPLMAAAIELLKKYREFSDSEIKAAADTARRQLSDYVRPLAGLDLDDLATKVASEVNGGPDVLTPAKDVIGRLKDLHRDVVSNIGTSWDDKDAILGSLSEVIATEEKKLGDHIGQLQSSVDERAEALKTKQKELDELKGKKTASLLLPQIEKRVTDAKWVARAIIVKNNISGVLRSLTDAAKTASEVLLNKDFEKRFATECKRLRAPDVTLNFPGRQGQVTRRKLVSSYQPSQVLSEGEQKALALADFLAEVTAISASSPVVFDDPITSMDYRRIHEVCDRIVALSANNQIIVFTHNIWFAAELLSKAEKGKWKYYDIRFDDGSPGVVTAASHPRVDTIAQVKTRVAKLVEAAEKADAEVRAALVEKGYEELRGLSEIVVEQELFKGVVQRYAPNIMMTKLDKINIGELQGSMAAIVPVFEKACRYVASHSQPLETQGIRPTLDELKADFAVVMKAWEPHKT